MRPQNQHPLRGSAIATQVCWTRRPVGQLSDPSAVRGRYQEECVAFTGMESFLMIGTAAAPLAEDALQYERRYW